MRLRKEEKEDRKPIWKRDFKRKKRNGAWYKKKKDEKKINGENKEANKLSERVKDL